MKKCRISARVDDFVVWLDPSVALGLSLVERLRMTLCECGWWMHARLLTSGMRSSWEFGDLRVDEIDVEAVFFCFD